jgi:hypothetical protein
VKGRLLGGGDARRKVEGIPDGGGNINKVCRQAIGWHMRGAIREFFSIVLWDITGDPIDGGLREGSRRTFKPGQGLGLF